MNKQPLISVVMPVYNSETYLREAVDSILTQTFSDFEFIIVNDGSTDGSLSILQSYNDPRIVVVTNETNLGLPRTLNKGIALSHSKFIARMDADDISLPNRFEKQVSFMEQHPEISISGTYAQSIGTTTQVTMRQPTDPEEIKVNLLFKTSLIHPTIFMRRDFLVDNKLEYNPDFPQTQDYDFFTRAVRVGKIANLAKILLLYRKHGKQASTEKSKNQIEYAKKIIRRQFESVGIQATEEDLDIAVTLKRHLFIQDTAFPKSLESLLLKIQKANAASRIYSDKTLQKVFGDMWLEMATAYSSHGVHMWNVFWNGAPRKWVSFSLRNVYRIIKVFRLHIISFGK